MNVLILGDYRAPCGGNFIGSLHDLAKKFQHDDMGKLVFVFPEEKQWINLLCKYNCKTYFVEPDGNNSIEKIKKIVEDEAIDLIHIHFGFMQRRIVDAFGGSGNLRIVIHDHMDYGVDDVMIKVLIRQMASSLYYRLKNVSLISVMAKKSKGYFLLGKRNYYIPNGLSYIRNIDTNGDIDGIRNKLNLKQKKVCLFLGWDSNRKGIDIAIQAAQKLYQQDKSWVLAVVGYGEKPNVDVLRSLEQLCGICNFENFVRFLPSTEDMFSYHKMADVYLSASRKEAFSYGLLEAISQNTPIVASNIEGTKWANGYSKYFEYDTENSEACKRAILRAYDMKSSASNNIKFIEDYSIDLWIDSVLKVYNDSKK